LALDSRKWDRLLTTRGYFATDQDRQEYKSSMFNLELAIKAAERGHWELLREFMTAFTESGGDSESGK